jgi:hypothetical protein
MLFDLMSCCGPEGAPTPAATLSFMAAGEEQQRLLWIGRKFWEVFLRTIEDTNKVPTDTKYFVCIEK